VRWSSRETEAERLDRASWYRAQQPKGPSTSAPLLGQLVGEACLGRGSGDSGEQVGVGLDDGGQVLEVGTWGWDGGIGKKQD
jgi:hypothetical protein